MIRFLFAIPLLALAATGQTQLQTVPRVDLNRYAGAWYEIARLPNRFEKDCAAAVRAIYTARNDGTLGVRNECRKQDGKLSVASGYAKVADRTTQSKLRVTFFWPFFGDYWILELDPEYRYAVVGEPGRKYFWILGRTPKMEAAVYDGILKRAAAMGYDTGRVIRTPQSTN